MYETMNFSAKKQQKKADYDKYTKHLISRKNLVNHELG